MAKQMRQNATKEFAFYYPNAMWVSGDWAKNLILFFDGIALLVPDYMKDRPEREDPAIVRGLREHNLLHIIEPERSVDNVATEKLVSAMTDIITSGALDQLQKTDTRFRELSMSRMGFSGDQGLARMILEELKQRNLARDSEDGVSIPMHPDVRSLILILLAQILRPYGANLDAELSPATDSPALVTALAEMLALKAIPSTETVIQFDLSTVGVDLVLCQLTRFSISGSSTLLSIGTTASQLVDLLTSFQPCTKLSEMLHSTSGRRSLT